MRLSLAPPSGRYPADAIIDFYREAAAAPDVDRVYIGEPFCAKRLIPLRAFEESVQLLEAAGKEVVFSTLALPAEEADYEAVAPYAERVRAVEVNSLGFVPWLKEHFANDTVLAGPLMSLYNRDDLEVVRDLGCSGVSLRIDLMPETVADLAANGALPVEVFCHGRPPLAHSWRCYASRFAGRPQNECGHVCREQNGLVLKNLEGADGFVVDGLAVLSGQVVATVDEVVGSAEAGAAFGRLWLGPGEVGPVSTAYAALLRGERSAEEVRSALGAATDGTLRYGPVARRRLS